jgi:hypothetical protein
MTRFGDICQSALPDSDAAVIDDHFSSCDLCIDVARAAHERALALETWSARSQGGAWKRELVARAVDEISHRAGEPLAERLKIWQRNLRQATAGAVEVLADLSGARFVAAGLAEIVRPGGWRFEPVGAVRDRLGEPSRAALVSQATGLRVEALPDGQLAVSAARWPKDMPLPSVVIIDKGGTRPPVALELARDEAGHISGVVPAPSADSLIVFLNDLP